MPLVGFICPDGIAVDLEDCISHCRYTGGRCLTIPTLQLIDKLERDVIIWKCTLCEKEIHSSDYGKTKDNSNPR